jgi:hypothetical protein
VKTTYTYAFHVGGLRLLLRMTDISEKREKKMKPEKKRTNGPKLNESLSYPDNASSDLMMWILYMQRLQVVHDLLCDSFDLLPEYMILELLYKLPIVWMITVFRH